ncbi:hypothetical protein J0H58_04200 [bacterium]|nr:hypothetical protein [bacterium]
MRDNPSPPAKNEPAPDVSLQPKPGEQETTPAQERGERIDHGKAVARGGKETGKVPGAEPDRR